MTEDIPGYDYTEDESQLPWNHIDPGEINDLGEEQCQ